MGRKDPILGSKLPRRITTTLLKPELINYPVEDGGKWIGNAHPDMAGTTTIVGRANRVTRILLVFLGTVSRFPAAAEPTPHRSIHVLDAKDQVQWTTKLS